jgi:hypothetical protein
MISRAEISSLRNTAMRTDTDLGQIVDPQIFPQPRMIADLEVPRKLDAKTGLNVNALADLRSEQAKKPASKRRGSDPM